MRKKPYLSVVYDPSQKPLTDYPNVFAEYVFNRLRLCRDQQLLDAGCGRAEMVNAFDRLGLAVSGCDLEAPPRDVSRVEIKKVDFTRDKFPYEDGQFDVVLSKSVIEHLFDPDHYLREIYRVLKPGGGFILLTPDWTSQMKVFYEDHTHVHPYLPLGVERMLRLHGFEIDSIELFCHHAAIWRNPAARFLACANRLILSAPSARWLTRKTGIKFFRWSVELQILAIARK